MTIDAAGNIHDTATGQFSGHVLQEGDAGQALGDPLTGQPFMVKVRLERWDGRDEAFEVDQVEFDATSLLRSLDGDQRQATLDRFGGADWLFEHAVDRGLLPEWGGPFTVDFESDEMEEWFAANPTDATPRVTDLGIGDLAEMAGVERPEPGSAGAQYLVEIRQAAAELAEREPVTRQAVTNAVGMLLGNDEDRKWQVFTSLRLYDARHQTAGENTFTNMHESLTARLSRVAQSSLEQSLSYVGVQIEESAPKPAPAPSQPQVVDLVAALRGSVEAAKERRLSRQAGEKG